MQIEAEVINGRKRVIGKLEEEEEDGDTPSTTADHSSFKKFQFVQTSVSVDENIENVVKSTVSSASESGGPYTVQAPPPPPTEENHEPSCCEQKSSPNFDPLSGFFCAFLCLFCLLLSFRLGVNRACPLFFYIRESSPPLISY